jgi:hypothetical protein
VTSNHRHGTTGKYALAGDIDKTISALAARVTAAEQTIAQHMAAGTPSPAVWSPLYVVGDPGYGLDSDFLGTMAQVSGLSITAERKATPSGRAYASACIAAPGIARCYGTFEARIRYPAGQGVWPAFWLLKSGTVTTPPEVDILEAYPAHPAGGGSGVDSLITSNHTSVAPSDYFVTTRPGMSGGWHVHRLTWSAGLMVFTIDGIESGRIAANVPAVPMYPILTLALGAPGFRVDATTPSVLTMDVEYVRVTA